MAKIFILKDQKEIKNPYYDAELMDKSALIYKLKDGSFITDLGLSAKTGGFNEGVQSVLAHAKEIDIDEALLDYEKASYEMSVNEKRPPSFSQFLESQTGEKKP